MSQYMKSANSTPKNKNQRSTPRLPSANSNFKSKGKLIEDRFQSKLPFQSTKPKQTGDLILEDLLQSHPQQIVKNLSHNSQQMNGYTKEIQNDVNMSQQQVEMSSQPQDVTLTQCSNFEEQKEDQPVVYVDPSECVIRRSQNSLTQDIPQIFYFLTPASVRFWNDYSGKAAMISPYAEKKTVTIKIIEVDQNPVYIRFISKQGDKTFFAPQWKKFTLKISGTDYSEKDSLKLSDDEWTNLVNSIKFISQDFVAMIQAVKKSQLQPDLEQKERINAYNQIKYSSSQRYYNSYIRFDSQSDQSDSDDYR